MAEIILYKNTIDTLHSKTQEQYDDLSWELIGYKKKREVYGTSHIITWYIPQKLSNTQFKHLREYIEVKYNLLSENILFTDFTKV